MYMCSLLYRDFKSIYFSSPISNTKAHNNTNSIAHIEHRGAPLALVRSDPPITKLQAVQKRSQNRLNEAPMLLKNKHHTVSKRRPKCQISA